MTVGRRTNAGRELFRRYFASAIEVPGPETEQLAALTVEFGCHVVIGVIERSASTLYCTAVFFGPHGYAGKHRKLMPTAAERIIWGCGDGSTMPVVDTGTARLSSAIGWENYMPLFRTAMYAKGVDIWCAPTVDDRDGWQATMRHIALEGRCFVLSANQYLLREDLPADIQAMQRDTSGPVLIGGGSTIISPLGEILAGPLRDGTGILTATVDLGQIARGRFDFDPVGHYSRPDIFALTVDERPHALLSAHPAIDSERHPVPAQA